MGCYDIVLIPCPVCGNLYMAQSKGGSCCLRDYSLEEAPDDVLSDVNRHAPFTCDCGAVFKVVFDQPEIKTELVKVLAEKWANSLITYDEVKSTMDNWSRSSCRVVALNASKTTETKR